MSHAIIPAVAILLCLGLASVVSYDLAPLFLKPRTRFPVVRIARPGGPPPLPASGAAQDDWRRRGLPDPDEARKPGSAGLPAIDPATLAHLRRRMAGLPAHQRSAPVTAGYALGRVPSWGRDGANPYPAETIVDLPAIPAVRPYALSPVRAGCPSSPAGGHCCRDDGGTWTCLVPGCPR